MVDQHGKLKLANFGKTTDLSTIYGGGFAWGWADQDARYGVYSKTSELFSFAVLGCFTIGGESPYEDDDAYQSNELKMIGKN
jgi:hypothetical protein